MFIQSSELSAFSNCVLRLNAFQFCQKVRNNSELTVSRILVQTGIGKNKFQVDIFNILQSLESGRTYILYRCIVVSNAEHRYNVVKFLTNDETGNKFLREKTLFLTNSGSLEGLSARQNPYLVREDCQRTGVCQD